MVPAEQHLLVCEQGAQPKELSDMSGWTHKVSSGVTQYMDALAVATARDSLESLESLQSRAVESISLTV